MFSLNNVKKKLDDFNISERRSSGRLTNKRRVEVCSYVGRIQVGALDRQTGEEQIHLARAHVQISERCVALRLKGLIS